MEILELDHNLIKDISFLENLDNHSESFSVLRKLLYLNLEHNQIEDMCPLKTFSNLRKLDLSNNRIKYIDCVKHLRKLEIIDLSDNNIKEPGLKTETLASIASLPHLMSLNLRGNNIIDSVLINSLESNPNRVNFDNNSVISFHQSYDNKKLNDVEFKIVAGAYLGSQFGKSSQLGFIIGSSCQSIENICGLIIEYENTEEGNKVNIGVGQYVNMLPPYFHACNFYAIYC